MKALVIVLSLVSTSLWAAQTCVSSVVSTTPTARFSANADDTVTDTATGLMWQRCSYGQTFSSATQSCTGTAQQLNWQQALTAAKNDEFADFKDWHVPSVKELASIIEHQCVEPAANTSVFTDALDENYWSSTTAIKQIDHAWAYQFADGKNNIKAKTSDVFLRLVRYSK
ncbi:hypothetical protein PCIT_a3228 [Pseudoalteromonas citrea]|uniref:Lcl C-terminal domain-containing protein n=2 Tax=Pseudoalteromonas citrea TaxID=43655 RepID=A0AAD4FR16_9GAMM|nr:DUF1566 domain-containing protein [Pseudoalteromonas citrea]KAF7768738.1 hypothetical protein PCIT_a3228 [Pseudoalteromonas citrea]